MKILVLFLLAISTIPNLYAKSINNEPIGDTSIIEEIIVTDSLAKPKETQQKGLEGLTYQQQPGLALAASKIFFSKKRYSISGFGEVNYVQYFGDKNTNVGDLELYYTNLYRFATFFGFRITDKIIWNSEFQIELLHDKKNEFHYEIVFEAFMDFLINKYFKTRIGFYPLTIGYVNNNDEPVMFYSVNRAEVERLIIPSTWIEFGLMFYGNFTKDLSYAMGISQGVNANQFIGSSWIRQGRDISFIPKSISFNPQLTYTGVKNLTLSTSGYFGNSGQRKNVDIDGEKIRVKAPIKLGTAYAKYEWDNFKIISVGTYGSLGETPLIYQLTMNENLGFGEVLGGRVYGFLFEGGIDLMKYIRGKRQIDDKHNWFYSKSEMKLPLFFRYERLNTHHKISSELVDLPRNENDLDIWTIGLNYNTKENIVFKINYQFRNNRYKNPVLPKESNLLEMGIGFIF